MADRMRVTSDMQESIPPACGRRTRRAADPSETGAELRDDRPSVWLAPSGTLPSVTSGSTPRGCPRAEPHPNGDFTQSTCGKSLRFGCNDEEEVSDLPRGYVFS